MNRRGAALLEVLAAVVILGGVGAALVSLQAAAARAEGSAREQERDLIAQDRLLAGHVLLNRGDLDLRLGSRVVGQWRVEIQRPEPALYSIAVSAAGTGANGRLVTLVWRPEPAAAERSEP